MGILESVWKLTSVEAPTGNIGKLSDEDIACAIGWKDCPIRLMTALEEARWIDRDPVHRYVIHDWSEHADDGVNNRLARSGQYFCDGKKPTFRRLSKEERERAEALYLTTSPSEHAHGMRTANAWSDVALPSLALPSQTTSHVNARDFVEDKTAHPSRRFEEFWEKYPRKQHKTMAASAWVSVVNAANEQEVFACLERYLDSDEVGSLKIQNPEKWLFEQHQDKWSGMWPTRNGISKGSQYTDVRDIK